MVLPGEFEVIMGRAAVIMGRAAVPPGQAGRNGHAQAWCEGGIAQVDGIARYPPTEDAAKTGRRFARPRCGGG